MHANRSRLCQASIRLSAMAALAVALLAVAAPAGAKTVILPWIAQTRGAIVQSSHLFVLNPGPEAMQVTLEFRKRGTPETHPPRASRTIPAGAVLRLSDPLRQLFDSAHTLGFLLVHTDGEVAPVVRAALRTRTAGGATVEHTPVGFDAERAATAGIAAPGQSLFFTGLDERGPLETSLWLFNAGPESASADVVYRGLGGRVLATAVVRLGAGKLRQINSGQHPIPATTPGYTVELQATAGEVVGVALATHAGGRSPVYLVGEPR